MDEAPNTSTGKIARLPVRFREAVNRRLLEGETGGEICAWLNAQAEVATVLARYFKGELVSEQNLSAWRNGAFRKWENEQKHIRRTRERAVYSMELAKASGGNLAEGALAQLSGELLELIEEISDLREAGQEINPKIITAAAKALAAVRAKELETQTLALNRERTAQNARDLELREAAFRMKTAETFLGWFEDEETRRIATSGDRKETKVAELVKHWFGEMPEGIGPPSLGAAA